MQNEDYQYAGFWIRVLAALIDTLLILLIIYPLLYKIYGGSYFNFTDVSRPMISGMADFLLQYILPAIASVIFWIYRQATPGKILLKIKIIDAQTGKPPTSKQCIGRYFGYYVSIIPLMLGIIWVAFDPKKQGWHDKLAGTLVVRYNKRPVVKSNNNDLDIKLDLN